MPDFTMASKRERSSGFLPSPVFSLFFTRSTASEEFDRTSNRYPAGYHRRSPLQRLWVAPTFVPPNRGRHEKDFHGALQDDCRQAIQDWKHDTQKALEQFSGLRTLSHCANAADGICTALLSVGISTSDSKSENGRPQKHTDGLLQLRVEIALNIMATVNHNLQDLAQLAFLDNLPEYFLAVLQNTVKVIGTKTLESNNIALQKSFCRKGVGHRGHHQNCYVDAKAFHGTQVA
jgi:hypothetical protein